MCVCVEQIFEWADAYVPSDREAKYCFYNEHRDAVDAFESDGIVEIDSLDNIANRLIKTIKIKTYLNILRTYLLQEIPFRIVGPSGSGTRCVHIHLSRGKNKKQKFIFSFLISLLVNNVVSDLAGYELVTINCSSQLTTSYVLHQIKQVNRHISHFCRPFVSITVLFVCLFIVFAELIGHQRQSRTGIQATI